jgi:hypothetical protein
VPRNDESQDLISLVFNRATALKEAKEGLYEQLAANRRMLRDLAAQGLLSDEQQAQVIELYPPKQRKVAEEVVEATE